MADWVDTHACTHAAHGGMSRHPRTHANIITHTHTHTYTHAHHETWSSDIHHVKRRLFWNRNVNKLPSLFDDLPCVKSAQKKILINDTTWHALLLIIAMLILTLIVLTDLHHMKSRLFLIIAMLILTLIVLTDLHHMKSRLFWKRSVKHAVFLQWYNV